MRALPVLIALTLASGCASSREAAAPSDAPQAVAAPGSRIAAILRREAAGAAADLDASPARVWPLVVQAYNEIGLPMDHLDQQAKVATTANQRVRRIAGKGPGTYFNCPGPYGNAANRDDVYLKLRTEVVPGHGSGTILRIAADAVAKSTTAANTITYCSSTAALEQLIANRVLHLAADAGFVGQ